MNRKLTRMSLAAGIVALSGSLLYAQDFSARLMDSKKLVGWGQGKPERSCQMVKGHSALM